MSLYPSLKLESKEIEKMSITLEIAEKMLIKFDGNKTKLYEFIDNCDKAYNLIKTEYKEILFAIIETKLTDNARSVVRNRSFEDWPSLKNHLLDIYSERRTMSQWQLELNSCKQNFGESVISFSNKIENCYIKITNALDVNLSKEAREACINLLKNEALNVFITGLQKDIAVLVKSQKPDTLEKAIAVALNEEQEFKSKQEIFKYQNINNSHAKHCTNCNKAGHTLFNCRFNRNQNFKFKQNEHNIRYLQPPNPNQPGQITLNPNINSNPNPNSNSNSKFCRYCKKNGHIIEECRKRQFNNSKKINTYQPSSTNSTKDANLNAQSIRPVTAESKHAHSVQAVFHK